MKSYPDPNTPAVAPTDAHSANAAADETRLDKNTRRRAEMIRSVQQPISVQVRRPCIKNMTR